MKEKKKVSIFFFYAWSVNRCFLGVDTGISLFFCICLEYLCFLISVTTCQTAFFSFEESCLIVLVHCAPKVAQIDFLAIVDHQRCLNAVLIYRTDSALNFGWFFLLYLVMFDLSLQIKHHSRWFLWLFVC